MKLIRIQKDAQPMVCVQHNNEWFACKDMQCMHSHREALTTDNGLLYILQHPALQTAIMQELANTKMQPVVFEWEEMLLPFAPRSLRDYMLFEQHVIDATRGYVRRFLPKKYRIASIVEKLTGKPPRGFYPKPLWYKHPIYYMGNHLNVVGNYAAITFPPYSKALDYELELAAVLVSPIKDATPAEAEAAIGGFMVFNDFSARDVQAAEMQSGFGPVKAKNFINAISTVVVTANEVLPYINTLKAQVSINGVVVSNCSSAGMRYSIGEAIAYASAGEQLHAGELFATGTFPGGSGMETNNWLRVGDRLELSIDRVGSLVSFIE